MLTIHTIGPKTHVLMRLFPFGCISDRFAITRKRAKLEQLMQKFVLWCLVRIFHKERSWSIPLDTNLMFWCVSFCLGAFGTISLLHKTCCKTRQTVQLMQKFVPWCLVRIYATNAPDPQHSSLRSSFGVFLSVRVHFGPFRYCTKLAAKCANWCN